MEWRSSAYLLLWPDENGAIDLESTYRNFRGTLDALDRHGANTVTLTWFNPVDPLTGVFEDNYGPTMPSYFQGLPSDEKLRNLTQIAQDRGFNVIWKPQFVTDNADAGNINPYYVDAGFDTNQFLNGLNDFWDRLAPIAEAEDVDMLIVGTEHAEYGGAPYEAAWREIIADIRAVYDGELTYSALSKANRPSFNFDDVPFWDALDYIGISAYFLLNDGNSPSFDDASRVLRYSPVVPWQTTPRVDMVQYMADFAAAEGREILFTEAGGAAIVGGLTDPNQQPGTPDTYEQAIAYAVVLSQYSDQPWFAGINWWGNLDEHVTATETLAWAQRVNTYPDLFDFVSKPSADIVRAFWDDNMSAIPLDGTIRVGGEGADILSGTANGDIIVGGHGNDLIDGAFGDDRLFGGDQSDEIFGNLGNDWIFGGTSFNDGDDDLFGGGGNDHIFGHLGDDLINGDAGSDRIEGNQGNDTVAGGTGDDVLINAMGNNLASGGDDNDLIVAHSGSNQLFGDAGADLLIGGVGDDRLNGGSGNDALRGDLSGLFFGNDRLNGGSGNDLLEGGGGADEFVFNTRSGTDTIATLDLDLSNPGVGVATGDDFTSGVDTILLNGFGYTSGAEAFALVSNVGGHATFSDQGTTIIFYDLLRSDLSVEDFVL